MSVHISLKLMCVCSKRGRMQDVESGLFASRISNMIMVHSEQHAQFLVSPGCCCMQRVQATTYGCTVRRHARNGVECSWYHKPAAADRALETCINTSLPSSLISESSHGALAELAASMQPFTTVSAAIALRFVQVR